MSRSRRSVVPVAALPLAGAVSTDSSAGLLRRGRDRKHDVGQLGHRRASQLERDQQRHPGQSLAGGLRVGQVVEVDAGHHQAVEVARRGRSEDAVRLETDLRGRLLAPDAGDFGAGDRVRDGPATGQQRREGAGFERPASMRLGSTTVTGCPGAAVATAALDPAVTGSSGASVRSGSRALPSPISPPTAPRATPRRARYHQVIRRAC